MVVSGRAAHTELIRVLRAGRCQSELCFALVSRTRRLVEPPRGVSIARRLIHHRGFVAGAVVLNHRLHGAQGWFQAPALRSHPKVAEHSALPRD